MDAAVSGSVMHAKHAASAGTVGRPGEPDTEVGASPTRQPPVEPGTPVHIAAMGAAAIGGLAFAGTQMLRARSIRPTGATALAALAGAALLGGITAVFQHIGAPKQATPQRVDLARVPSAPASGVSAEPFRHELTGTKIGTATNTDGNTVTAALSLGQHRGRHDGYATVQEALLDRTFTSKPTTFEAMYEPNAVVQIGDRLHVFVVSFENDAILLPKSMSGIDARVVALSQGPDSWQRTGDTMKQDTPAVAAALRSRPFEPFTGSAGTLIETNPSGYTPDIHLDGAKRHNVQTRSKDESLSSEQSPVRYRTIEDAAAAMRERWGDQAIYRTDAGDFGIADVGVDHRERYANLTPGLYERPSSYTADATPNLYMSSLRASNEAGRTVHLMEFNGEELAPVDGLWVRAKPTAE